MVPCVRRHIVEAHRIVHHCEVAEVCGGECNHPCFRVITSVGYGDHITGTVDVPHDDALGVRKFLCSRGIGDGHRHGRIGIVPVGLPSVDGQSEPDERFVAYGDLDIVGQGRLVAFADTDLRLVSIYALSACQHIGRQCDVARVCIDGKRSLKIRCCQVRNRYVDRVGVNAGNRGYRNGAYFPVQTLGTRVY